MHTKAKVRAPLKKRPRARLYREERKDAAAAVVHDHDGEGRHGGAELVGGGLRARVEGPNVVQQRHVADQQRHLMQRGFKSQNQHVTNINERRSVCDREEK